MQTTAYPSLGMRGASLEVQATVMPHYILINLAIVIVDNINNEIPIRT